jgi:hypothetical protein
MRINKYLSEHRTHTGGAPGLENKRFGARADPKCDWRVNICGMWGHVGIRERTFVTPDVLHGIAGHRTFYTSIRQLSTALLPSVFASQDPWPSSAPVSPAAIGERLTYAPCPTSVAHGASTSLQQSRHRRFPVTRHARCERVQRSPSSTPGYLDRTSGEADIHFLLYIRIYVYTVMQPSS